MKAPIKNILIIENSLSYTGAFKSILNYALTLKKNFNFIWVIPKHSTIKTHLNNHSFHSHEIRFHEISKSLKVYLYPYRLLRNSWKLRNIVKDHDIDIVHVNDMYNMCGLLLKLICRVKVVYHVRLLPTSYIGKFFYVFGALINHFADKICIVSNAVGKFIKNPNKVVFLPDWVDAPHLNMITDNGKKNSELVLLYVGVIMEGKGQMEAMKVARTVKEKTELFKIRFIGSYDLKDRYYQSLVKYTERYKLQKHVTFAGFCENIEVEYLRGDLLINLSFSESFSLVSLEAGQHGLPVISYNSGGPSDIIVDGYSGYIIEIGEIDQVSNLIINLAKDRQLLNELGENARKVTREKYNSERLTKQLSSLYNHLI